MLRRIEALSQAGQWQKLGGAFEGRSVGQTQVKGRSAPVNIHAVEAGATDAGAPTKTIVG